MRSPKENPDLSKTTLIDLGIREDVEYWTAKFDITKVQLKAAINAVGNHASDVQAWLLRR